jgi:glyoxylase-like metal-dependent hydrolase (beta-lactamase superfamily II)
VQARKWRRAARRPRRAHRITRWCWWRRQEDAGHSTDLLPASSHLPLPFIASYDLFPVGTLEAKRRLLARAVEEDWQLLFYHDPRTPLGRVRCEKDKYQLNEVPA